ncbi:MAG: PocR ligand-binding domain-containing protein [Nitrospinae bacterium]|nr:PocR ligand-binding domain-containing protein [Nitrospinota bacterium]
MDGIEEALGAFPVRSMVGEFCDRTGMMADIIGLGAGETLVAEGMARICVQYHQDCPRAELKCKDYGFQGMEGRSGKPVVKQCEIGLVTGIAPIFAKGRHVANLFAGPALLAPVDEDVLCAGAAKRGMDETVYSGLYHRIPRVGHDDFIEALERIAAAVNLKAEGGFDSTADAMAHEHLEKAEAAFIIPAHDADVPARSAAKAHGAKIGPQVEM